MPSLYVVCLDVSYYIALSIATRLADRHQTHGKNSARSKSNLNFIIILRIYKTLTQLTALTADPQSTLHVAAYWVQPTMSLLVPSWHFVPPDRHCTMVTSSSASVTLQMLCHLIVFSASDCWTSGAASPSPIDCSQIRSMLCCCVDTIITQERNRCLNRRWPWWGMMYLYQTKRNF